MSTQQITFGLGVATGLAIATLLTTLNSNSNAENSARKLESAVRKLENDLVLSTEKQQSITSSMRHSMKLGLRSDGQGLKMLPAFVSELPKGSERGTCLSIDLGGSTLRICEAVLLGNSVVRTRQKKFSVGAEFRSGHATVLFDYVASCLADFLIEYGINSHKEMKLGFSFSFPVKQTAINKVHQL